VLLDAGDLGLEDKLASLAAGWRELDGGGFDLFSTAAEGKQGPSGGGAAP
jgi:hypothetical protein